MSDSDSPWLRHHRQRWLRHDAHLWIRPDAARFFPPGTDPAVINPTLPRKPDAAKADALEPELAAEVAKGYRLLAVLRAEVAELRADVKRRRELEAKYSPSQPRVPAGNPDGGQWTDRGAGRGTVANPSQGTATSLAQPMGNVGIGDVSGSSELGDLFRIKPNDTRVEGVRLAANDTPDDPAMLARPAFQTCAFRSPAGLLRSIAQTALGAAPHSPDVVV